MPRRINCGEYEEKTRRADTHFLDPRAIKVDWGRNGRDNLDPAEMAKLVANIRKYGQLQPITCRSLPDRSAEIIYGYRRLRAALIIVEDTPEFRIETKILDGVNDKDAFVNNIIENAHRLDLSAIETASNIRKLIHQYGFSKQEAAELYERSPTWVNQKLDLLTLPESVKAAIQGGELTGEAGLVLAKLPESDASSALEEARDQIAAEDAVGTAADPDLKAAVNGEHSPRVKRPKPKAAKDLTPAEIQSRKTARQARLSAATKQAAAAKGVKIGRGLAELRAVLKGRQDDVSRKLLGFLTGDVSEDDLIYALDTSESPITV